jgi:hypothetical protein
MKDLETIEQAIILLKSIKSTYKKKERLSEKARNTNFTNSTPSQIDKATSNLNWECMEYSKAKVNFARLFKDSILDVSTEVQTYRPSGFHEYTH